ncbi:hypothetical protein GCM10007967_11240 [Xylanimonas ulmi]
MLVLRASIGLLILGHAAQKTWGALGGEGLTATAAIFERVGYRPGRPMVVVASILELLAGALLIVGLLTTLAGALLTAVMAVACSAHWPRGLWAAHGGFELPLLFGVVAAALTLTGPGGWSLDAVVEPSLPPATALVVLPLALAAAIGAIALRSAGQAKTPSRSPRATPAPPLEKKHRPRHRP